jgi:hypothetical protein
MKTTHKHRPIPRLTVIRCYSGPVSDRPNFRAHGWACETQTCRCGAVRLVNFNNGHFERGQWGETP